MYMTTKALVLRTVDYRDADKILTLLTEEQGKLTASARGCRRKGSVTAAGCQLLCWSELVLYERNNRWFVKEAATLRQFRGVRDDLERLALACYFAEVTQLLAVEGERSPELLSLILNSLHALDEMQEKPLALVKAAFELRAMCLAGYEPLLEGCAVCGAEQPQNARFQLQNGLLYCTACQPETERSVPVPPQALAAMRHIAYGNPKRLFSFPASGGTLNALAALTEAYLQTQLERSFHTLDFYKQLLGKNLS